jgi:anti-sigma factor RsiW
MSMIPRLRLPLRGRWDIACQQAVGLVTDHLEGALPRAGRGRLEAHRADCPHCTEYLAQMRATIALTGDLSADDLARRCRTSSPRCSGSGAPPRTARDRS